MDDADSKRPVGGAGQATLYTVDLTDAENPCQPDEHEWQYEAGDHSVGINGGWVCTTCGALHDGPAPDDDWPEEIFR